GVEMRLGAAEAVARVPREDEVVAAVGEGLRAASLSDPAGREREDERGRTCARTRAVQGVPSRRMRRLAQLHDGSPAAGNRAARWTTGGPSPPARAAPGAASATARAHTNRAPPQRRR